MAKRLRATVIVPTADGIMLTLDRSGLYLLPGGLVERRELPIIAAVRELHEETGLVVTAIRHFGEHESRSNLHQIFVVTAYTGQPSAGSDAKAIAWHTSRAPDRYWNDMSPATRVVIGMYDAAMAKSRNP